MMNFLEEFGARMVYAGRVTEDEIKALMRRFRDWCEAVPGRKAQAAEALKVSRQQISNWLAEPDAKWRRSPSTKHFLAIQKFMRGKK